MENKKVNENDMDLVSVLFEIIKTLKHTIKVVVITLIVSILSNVVIAGMFVYYELQFDVIDEVKTTEQISVDGENATLNSVSGDQYNDNAVHNEK